MSSVEDKCYLDSRLSGVVHSDSGSEGDTLVLSSQVTVPLVINDDSSRSEVNKSVGAKARA